MFPGNIDMADKTLHNWRTEIPALFGFYKENKKLNTTETSRMATFLHENQDLTQFLRLFLFSFQFPGGHLKPQDLKGIILHGIRFKPARTIVRVLMAGNHLLHQFGSEKEMNISAEPWEGIRCNVRAAFCTTCHKLAPYKFIHIYTP